MFHNGSTYDYHFIIRELAEEFEGELECSGENTKKYITFSVPIKKEITKKDKNGNDKITKILYKIKFIDSYRFMSTSLSNLVSNLSERLHTDRCIDCKSLPDKEAFYSNLNMEDITDVDYRHAKIVLEYLINKNLGDYHDLYVQSDTLLLANVFENFRNMCIKVYELNPAHFLSAPGLAWHSYLKQTRVKLELLTDVDMLLMVEKGIRGGICHVMHGHEKAINKYMKNYNKGKEEPVLEYLDANNLYGWAMSEPLPVDGFEWIEDLCKIDEDFIKNYDDSVKGYILEVDVEYPKHLKFSYLRNISHYNLPFLPEKRKINKIKKLICNLSDKEKYVVHIRSLKQALNLGLILKKVHRVIQI